MAESMAKANPRCYLCNHERLHEANKDIRAGLLSHRAIGIKYGCSDQSVRRHRIKHMAGVVPVEEIPEALPPVDVPELSAQAFIADLLQINNKVKDFLNAELNKRKKSISTISALSREVRQTMELLIKVAIVQRKLDESLPSPDDDGDVPASIQRSIDLLFNDPEIKDALPALPTPEDIMNDEG